MVSPTDITFVYSGGETNREIESSLGGSASIYPIVEGLNNLFPNIEESSIQNTDFTDYRCLYMFNDSLIDPFSNVTIAMSENLEVFIGLDEFLDDEQSVLITGTATGGSVTLKYEETNLVWNYDADVDTWANNLKIALNNLSVLSEVVVTGISIVGGTLFTATFAGADGNRNHQLLELVSNDLTGITDITIEKEIEGGPINKTTTTIATPTVSPANVAFGQPILEVWEIGNMHPGDRLPIWVKRNILQGTTPLISDGVSLTIEGD